MSKSILFRHSLLLHLIDRAISICSRNPIIRSPSINHDKISFVYAGDIWVAGDGSNVQRITAFDGVESAFLQMDN
jgi:hypothetical protein